MPINNWAPRVETTIRDLERRVKKLETQPALNRAGINGPVTVRSPGVLTVESQSQVVFQIGQRNLSDGSGRTEMATMLWRDDGTLALTLADLGTTPGHIHEQALQWFDRSGNVVFADDTTSGVGVSRPHVPSYALQNTNLATWPSTAATTLTQIAGGYLEYQHPRLELIVEVYAPASVSATFQLQVNSTVVSSYSLGGGPSGQFGNWQDNVAMPSGLTYGSIYPTSLLAQVTSGSGTVSAQPFLLQGVGS